MEIERKFTLKSLPDNLESYPSHHIEQVYLNYNPVIRARKQDDEYYLTYKGSGMMARDESNLPLNEESYYHLRHADGVSDQCKGSKHLSGGSRIFRCHHDLHYAESVQIFQRSLQKIR